MKVVDNIQIKIKNIHFRLEDHFSGDTSYTFGIVMKALEVHTTNEQWAATFIDRSQKNQANLYKLLTIEDFGFYLNPNDNFIIHQQTKNPDHQVQMMDSIFFIQDHLVQKNNGPASNLNYVLNPSTP